MYTYTLAIPLYLFMFKSLSMALELYEELYPMSVSFYLSKRIQYIYRPSNRETSTFIHWIFIDWKDAVSFSDFLYFILSSNTITCYKFGHTYISSQCIMQLSIYALYSHNRSDSIHIYLYSKSNTYDNCRQDSQYSEYIQDAIKTLT